MIVISTMYVHASYMQADIPRLWPSQVVRVIDDMAEVMKLQVGHGEWRDGMENVSPIFTKLATRLDKLLLWNIPG